MASCDAGKKMSRSSGLPTRDGDHSKSTPAVKVAPSGGSSITNINTANTVTPENQLTLKDTVTPTNTVISAHPVTPANRVTPVNPATPAAPDTSTISEIPENVLTLGSEVPLANRVLAPSAAAKAPNKYSSATLPTGQGTKRGSSFGHHPIPSTLHPRVSVDSIYLPSKGKGKAVEKPVAKPIGRAAFKGFTDKATERDPGVGSSKQGNGFLQDMEEHTRKIRESNEAAAKTSAVQSSVQNGQRVVPVALLSPFVLQQSLQQAVASPEASPQPTQLRFPTMQEVESLQTGKVSYKAKINPFTTRSFINQTNSRLLSLPDEALIPVLTFLPPQDLAKLRHVSREFLSLFDKCEEFKKYHDTSRSTVWATPDPTLYFSGQSVDRLLPLCKRCRAVRGNDPLGRDLITCMPLLYCSQCKKKHRSMHFSQRQRNIEDNEERVCLGHEGAICIDKMLFVSWTQAVSASRNPSLNQFQCSTSIGQVNHHCSRLHCRFKSVTEVQFDRLDGNIIEMRVSKVFHFPFKRNIAGKVNASAFIETVNIIGSNAKEFESPLTYLCLSPTTGLRAFDPNVCDCLDWEEDERKFTSWTRRQFIFKRAPKPLGDGRPHLPGGYVGAHGRCVGRQHGFSSKHSMGKYEVDIFNCPDNPDLLVFQAIYTTTFKTASDLGWRGNLHAFTYHLEQDSDMRGVTWCDEIGCGVGQLASRHQSLPELEKRYYL